MRCRWHGFNKDIPLATLPGRLSIERLELDDRGAMVVSDPKRHRGRGVVDKHTPDVRKPREEVLEDLAGLRIETQHPIAVLPAAPRLAVLVRRHVVRPRFRRGSRPLLEVFGSRVEHPYPVAPVLPDPEP